MNNKIIIAAAVAIAIIAGNVVVYAQGSTVSGTNRLSNRSDRFRRSGRFVHYSRSYEEMMQIKADVKAGKLPQEKADEVDRILKEH